MMGYDINSDAEQEVTEMIDSTCASIVLRARHKNSQSNKIMPCINCADCASICPVNLTPQLLYELINQQELEQAKAYNLNQCIECGLCDFVCPSKIPLVASFKLGKILLSHQEQAQQKANLARDRTKARITRIELEKQTKELARQQKKKEILNKIKQQTQQKNNATINKVPANPSQAKSSEITTETVATSHSINEPAAVSRAKSIARAKIKAQSLAKQQAHQKQQANKINN